MLRAIEMNKHLLKKHPENCNCGKDVGKAHQPEKFNWKVECVIWLAVLLAIAITYWLQRP